MMLRGKTALVTGSTSGIGLGIARALASEGANVVVNGLGDPDVIAKLGADLASEFSVQVHYDDANLANPGEVSALVQRTHERFGRLDVLVNNAGIQHVSPIETFDAALWDQVIAINLSAVFHAMKAAIPLMRSQGWGRVINVASAHGLVASPFKVAYVAAKHGVVGATKVAALETANDNLTVNAICPGWVLTPLVERQLSDRAEANATSVAVESRELLREKQPMLEFTTPEAIGAMAIYLCSDAARTITGAALSIDGGWVAQ